MNDHTLTQLSPRAQSLLEQALQGESDVVKARVLRLVIESGINPEEEFFIISLGLNHLKVLLLQAPEQLLSWYSDLENMLDTWAGSYAQMLHAIAQKAEATNALTETAGQLSTMLTSHTQSCNALIKQLQLSYRQTEDVQEQQATFNKSVKADLERIEKSLTQQTATFNNQLKELTVKVQKANKPDPIAALGLTPDRGWKSAIYYSTAFMVILAAISITFLATFYIRDRSLYYATAQKIEYLLIKQNRYDCLEGIKAPDSDECKAAQ